jgi:hypothetical protein
VTGGYHTIAESMADIILPVQYDQFFLFGDSITQDSYDQGRGFGFSAALQAGQYSSIYLL